MEPQTYDKPSEVQAEHGRVLVDGPDDVDFAFTPDAATETGKRLLGKAQRAHDQSEASLESDEHGFEDQQDSTPSADG